MPCKLSKSTNPLADFSGAVGQEVQITTTGDKGKAFIKSAIYAGQNFNDPWKFLIVSGLKSLSVLIENPVPGDLTKLQEVCGDGSNNTLSEEPYDPCGPSQSIEIEGK